MSRVLPILFNTDMVRAILDGRKTVTRRVIKKLPDDAEFSGWLLDSTCQEDAKDIGSAGFKTLKQPTEKAGCVFVKPPYQPGDSLYVRETWCAYHMPDGSTIYEYMASDQNGNRRPTGPEYDDQWEIMKWHPSIHMPKEAARIWLKVKDVRVERLQEIDDRGCHAEGIEVSSLEPYFYELYKARFKVLWNSTIKKSDLDRYGWDANPWVWAIEFERCEKPGRWLNE